MLSDRQNAINGEKGEAYFSAHYGLDRDKDAISSLIEIYNLETTPERRQISQRDFDGVTTLYSDFVEGEIVDFPIPKAFLSEVKMKKKLTKFANSTTIEMANLLKHSNIHDDFLLLLGRHNGNGEMLDDPMFLIIRKERWNQAFTGFDIVMQRRMVEFCHRFEVEVRPQLLSYKDRHGIHMKNGDRETYRKIFENEIRQIQTDFRDSVQAGFKPLRKFNSTNSRFQLGATISALKSVGDLVPHSQFKKLITAP